MTTLVKIRGLDRTTGTAATGAVGSDMVAHGFRVPSGFGLQYPSGNKAFEIVGTVGAPNAAVTYTAKGAGTWGNNIQVVHATPTGTSIGIAVAYNSTAPYVTITVTPAATGALAHAADTANAVNQHAVASQYVIASLPGTGASVAVASADTNAVVSIAQATGTSTGGTFTLTFPGYGTTAAIAYNATGATVATAVALVTGGTVTGSGTTLPATTTLTFTGTLAKTPLAPVVVNNALNVGGTYSTTQTTWGLAAAGTLNAGTVAGTPAAATGANIGTGQPVWVTVNSKTSAVVDLDDGPTLRLLRRNRPRYISLGALVSTT